MDIRGRVKLIKNWFIRLYKSEEDIYYENLFIKNNQWNQSEPNDEEKERLEIIYKLIDNNILVKDLKILDLGCGRGWLTKKMSKYGETIGVEPITNVYKFSRLLFPDIKFYNVGYEKILKLFGKNAFDLIVSSEVIEHIIDEEKDNFIKVISKSLKNNGFLILTTPRKEAQEKWMEYGTPNQPIEEWMSEDDLKGLLVSNGFTPIEKRTYSISPNNTDYKVEIYQLWLFKKII